MECKLDIRAIPVGPLGTNCYLLCDHGECCLIDPGEEASRLLRLVAESGCTLRYILLTHGHFDHYTAVADILAVHGDLPVYIHEGDISEETEQLRFRRLSDRNQRFYAESDVLPLGDLSIVVMETPGHSRGSVVLRAENVLFTGDTLFEGSCGRTDFTGSNPMDMRDSLRRLAALPGDYYVLPGHGGFSTLENERRSNPYIR